MIKLIFIGGAILGILFFFSYYMGFWKPISVTESRLGPYHLIYQEHQGPYEEVMALFDDMKNIMLQKKLRFESMFGIYYDDPQKIKDQTKLRSEIGVIIKPENFKEAQQVLNDKKVQFRVLPQKNYIMGTFPYKNILSNMLGMMKVYPVLEKYAESKGYTEYIYKEKAYKDHFAMEIYKENEIHYLFTGMKNTNE